MGLSLAELIANIPVLPMDSTLNEQLIQRSTQLLLGIPSKKLHFLPDDSFWKVILSEPMDFIPISK
jgi:hypothetical protein